MLYWGYEVERWNIGQYLTEENLKIIDLYFHYKNYGWPYAGGWAEQPKRFVNMVMALDREMYKRKEAERKKTKSGK